MYTSNVLTPCESPQPVSGEWLVRPLVLALLLLELLHQLALVLAEGRDGVVELAVVRQHLAHVDYV